MGKIVLVGGSKGGIGKSMVSMSLIDYHFDNNVPILFIETDTSNPDVGKTYADVLNTDMLLLDLDKKDGWLNLLNTIGEVGSEKPVLINTAARNNTAIKNYGSLLNESLGELDRKLITLWPINRQRDSVELLKDYMGIMTNSSIYVLKNAYFGTPDKFEIYDCSKTKNIVEENGGTKVFPDLADRVSDFINTKRVPVLAALNDMPLGNRVELKRWRNECAILFAEIFQ